MRESLMDNLKDLLAVSNPGLVRRDDIQRLEERIAELQDMVDRLENALIRKLSDPPKSRTDR